ADHHALVRLAYDLERAALGGILAQAIADGGGTGRKGEETTGTGNQRTIRFGVGRLLRRSLARVDGELHAERDQMAVSRRMGDVARAQEGRLRKASPHAGKVVGAAWNEVAQRRPGPVAVGRREQGVLPFGVEVAVVPADIFLDHRPGGGMRRDVLDAS